MSCNFCNCNNRCRHHQRRSQSCSGPSSTRRCSSSSRSSRPRSSRPRSEQTGPAQSQTQPFFNIPSAIQVATTDNTTPVTTAGTTTLSFANTIFQYGRGIWYYPSSSSIQITKPGYYTVSFFVAATVNTLAADTASTTFTVNVNVGTNTVLSETSEAIAPDDDTLSDTAIVSGTRVIYIAPGQMSTTITLTVTSTASSIAYTDYSLTVAAIPPMNNNGQNMQNGFYADGNDYNFFDDFDDGNY